MGRQRLSVDRVGQEEVVAGGLGHRETPLVLLLDATLDPPIQAGEDHLNGVVQRSGRFQKRPQGRTRPLGIPDGLEQPRLAERAGRKLGPAVAGTFQGHGSGDGRPSLHVFKGQGNGIAYVAADGEPPRGWIDPWDVEVGQ